ncbi:MAG: c-type cytochrome [Trueperaceae bacterium]|nr:c-type cytochrome [Trueperaceae bacterium]
MLTAILIVLLALITVAYAAAPLTGRRSLVDPLPDERDPVLVDLEEERDSLLRAIRELDARLDLPADRRDELRARYESKAATVLKALERARSEAHGAADSAADARARADDARPATGRRLPVGALALLGVAAVTTAALGSFVLPRVGQGTVTTFFADELQTAEALRDLIRAAEREPNAANLMALGDAYWELADAAGAEETYRRVVALASDDGTSVGAPPIAYKRLALLVLQRDLPAALELLREARAVDPTDPETLYAIGELSFALGDLDASSEAFGAYLATPEGAGDPDAEARLALVQAIGPAASAVAELRDRDNLLALADVFWTAGADDPAVEIYFEVLSEHDASEPTALSRVGQLLFTRGRSDDAIGLLERAASAAGGLTRLEPQASLFLGNAYAVQGDDESAIRAWEAHVELVGVEAAGRVTGLIEGARLRLDAAGAEATATTPGDAPTGVPAGGSTAAAAEAAATRALTALSDPALLIEVGAELYARNCVVCHGAQGQGGTGVRLAGNARAANEANVRSTVRFGRGIMPGFGALLSEAEIEVLVRWVGQELATPR